MKKRSIYLYYIILLMFLQVFLVSGSVFAGVNDYYFKDFTGDYYLSKDEDGVSHLKVVESVTAVFPEFNQNKGICRQIPFTNRGGKNVTLPSLTKDNLKLTRNGLPEPIYSIEKVEDYYDVCTGNDDYVLGEQTYVFEYEFIRAVAEFADDERAFQELYWDTNGNGASQRFETVTARLHFEDTDVYTGDAWCYVGTYGSYGQERCKISEIEDGVEFFATDLAKFETLTFDVELKAGSFVIPGPEENYICVVLTVIVVAICLLIIIYFARKFIKTRVKSKYYKGLFVKPEYQPNDKYSLAEMAEVYVGKKKDIKVALLLEMVVKKKIIFKKVDKKWNILVKNIDGLGGEYVDLLAILNGGDKLKNGDEIEMKRRSANSELISLKKAIDKKILSDLKNDGLATSTFLVGGHAGGTAISIILMTPVIMAITAFAIDFLADVFGLNNAYGQVLVFHAGFRVSAFFAVIVTVIICAILANAVDKYEGHTFKGLDASKYMEGLKLYIKMAEADRIKFLQSVDKADVSAEGIVKLYEKLLPYAAVFGLEESWMKEMKKYCEVNEVEEPDYLMNGITTSIIMHNLRSAASYATTATTMASSGGGSSSGFSGGGGGGFAGGGGGGGGFSGR